MKTLTSRLYSGPADLQPMLDLLVAVRPAERITDFSGGVDPHELLALPVVQDNTRLWFDALVSAHNPWVTRARFGNRGYIPTPVLAKQSKPNAACRPRVGALTGR
jgi:hypothetical protein